MGYRIEYHPEKKKSANRYTFLMTIGVLVAVLLFFGRKYGLAEVFLPGDGAVTAAALDHAATALRDGKQLAEVFASFCQEVLDGAQIY